MRNIRYSNRERRQIAARDPVFRTNLALLDAKRKTPSWTWRTSRESFDQVEQWLINAAVRRQMHNKTEFNFRTGGNFNNIGATAAFRAERRAA